jgi:hypothetical protein
VRVPFRLLVLASLLASSPANAQEQKKEPGIVSLDFLDVGTLQFGLRSATPEAALKIWLEGHKLQKEKNEPEALRRYVDFLGTSGHRSLPARYAEMAQDRVDKIHDPVRRRFEKACVLYKTDRRAALIVFKDVGKQWLVLPEGRAAVQIWHSDALREAIDAATELKQLGKKKEARGPLEAAIRAHPNGVFMYAATTLLLDVGGPDLRPKKRDRGSDDDEGGIDQRPDGTEDDDDDGESEIEVND